MRATTFGIWNVSRAIRAVRTLELSPLVTAASAPASRTPACSRWSRSNPNPRTARPLHRSGSRRNALRRLSMMATEWPSWSSDTASSEPTRPHPTTITCMRTCNQPEPLMYTIGRSAGRSCTSTAGWRPTVRNRVDDGEAGVRGPPAGYSRTRASADPETDCAGRVLVRRHLVHRLRDGGDPLRHRPRRVEPRARPVGADPDRGGRRPSADDRRHVVPADDLRLPERRRLVRGEPGEPR